MPVYFIRAGEHGPVKIGKADNVASRIAAVQAGHPERLTILRVIEGGLKTEAWLHAHFRRLRVSREWFRFDASMLTITAPPEPETSPFARWIKENGGAEKVGRCLGVSGQAVRNWARDIGRPSIDSAFNLERISKGKVPAKSWAEVA